MNNFVAIGDVNNKLLVLDVQPKVTGAIDSTLGDLDSLFAENARQLLNKELPNSEMLNGNNVNLLDFVNQIDFCRLVIHDGFSTLQDDVIYTTNNEALGINLYSNASAIVRPYDIYLKMHVLKQIYSEVRAEVSSEQRAYAVRVNVDIQNTLNAMASTNLFVSLLPEKIVSHNGGRWFSLDPSMIGSADIANFVDSDTIPDSITLGLTSYEDGIDSLIANVVGVDPIQIQGALEKLDSLDLSELLNAEKVWFKAPEYSEDYVFSFDSVFCDYVKNTLIDNPSHYALAYQMAKRRVVVNVPEWFKGMNENIKHVANVFPSLKTVYKSIDKLNYTNVNVYDDMKGGVIEQVLLNNYDRTLSSDAPYLRRIMHGLQSSGFVNAHSRLAVRGLGFTSTTTSVSIHNGSESCTMSADPDIIKIVVDSLTANSEAGLTIRCIYNLSVFIDIIQKANRVILNAEGCSIYMNRSVAMRRMGLDILDSRNKIERNKADVSY